MSSAVSRAGSVVSLFDYVEAKGDRLDAELEAERQSETHAQVLVDEVRLYRAAVARRQRRRDKRLLASRER